VYNHQVPYVPTTLGSIPSTTVHEKYRFVQQLRLKKVDSLLTCLKLTWNCVWNSISISILKLTNL